MPDETTETPDEIFSEFIIDDHYSVTVGLALPDELSAIERSKFWLAKMVLLVGALLMITAWLLNMSIALWGMPDLQGCAGESAKIDCDNLIQIFTNRMNAANGIFEFAKSWIPPLITLVLGYYFARETSSSDS